MSDYQKLVAWILKVTIGTLAIIVVSVVCVLLMAFFDPSISNDDIFAIIGPAFNTVIGAFVGLLGGLSINGSGFVDKPTKEETVTDQT